MGFSLPPADFTKFLTGAIENIHLIFSKAPNSAELTRGTHWTQCVEAPDESGALSVFDQREQSAPDALHLTQVICCVRVRCLLGSRH